MYKTIRHATGGEMIVWSENKYGNNAHDSKTGKFTFKPMSAKNAAKASTAFEKFGKGANTTTQNLQTISKSMTPKRKPRKDLSNLSDAELQRILNRERMERDYDSYFNTPEESNGQKFVDGLGTALTYAAAVAAIVGTGFSIYATIKGKDTKKG